MPNKKIKIKLPNIVGSQYDIVICGDIVKTLETFIKKQKVSNVVIITDSNVKKLYGDKLLYGLKNNLQLARNARVNVAGGFAICNLQFFQAGEKNKTQNTVIELQNEMFELKCGRDTLVVALGGGVVGDVAGYVAATYMRGVPYIQVPTTLLSMVDSSVGGKTGVDNKYGKNLVGAFHQPLVVLADIKSLSTLPRKHIINGLIEATKMFITYDKEMFVYVKENYEKVINLDTQVLQKIILRAVELKASVVVRDEKEKGERSVLNFGHTIGHAIEKLSGYKILHGEAVGLGMLVEARVAVLSGKLSEKVYSSMEDLLGKMIKIERLKDFKVSEVLKEVKLDKKSVAGKSRFVLLKGVGKFCKQHGQYVYSVDDKVVKQALKYFN